MSSILHSLDDLTQIKQAYLETQAKYHHQVLICAGAGCVSAACGKVRDAAVSTLKELQLSEDVSITETGCMGICAVGPVMLILPERTFYVKLNPQNVRDILKAHLVKNKILQEHTFYSESLGKHIACIDDIDFFKEQVKIALHNCGTIAYGSIDAYIARDGYLAIAKTITGSKPEDVIRIVLASGLRGRGGAGFPTGVKWDAGRKADSAEKYMVCNADEGDPGAFMDRSIIEGDPHAILEGLMLGGYTIGANLGYVYIRAEYPLAIERLTAAIDQAHAYGLLGNNILGTDFSFDIEIRIGAGAFVCGEETALMASIEGKRGEPVQKPPFPFQKGLFGKPTIINNVETLAAIPQIILNGAAWYNQYGTETSKGTKVFALAGDIVNSGIVEVPIGTPLGEILFRIGGGILNKKQFKAAQIGGPSGGCITKENLNTPTDYESISRLGAIMGSGGLISMDEDTCMVDTARYFMDFIQEESCGKCVACRIGTKRMLSILERITRGEGREGDIELLEELGAVIKQTAMCELGKTAPNPVLSTIKYFREEYEEHIHKKYCRAGVCSDLFISPCENTCPANINIPGYLALIAAGRFMDAYDLICQENPLPSVCGRICTRPCESKCRRASVDEALNICSLKRFVADYAYKNQKQYDQDIVFPKNGKSVAIIGAGASGLTCAYYLSRIGYTVDVYESEPVAGGVLAYGIPEYRLPADVLEREIEHMRRSGFSIHLNTEVGRDVSFEQLRRDANAVYVATGTQLPQRMNIPGEDLEGVLPGIQFLKSVKLYHSSDLTGQVVAVIGGGNTAIDSARTALRLGAAKVMLLYRRTRDAMPAYDIEVEEALEEGVELVELVTPLQIIGDSHKHVASIECVRRKMSNFDNSGRRNTTHVEGSNFFIDVNIVIPAVSQYADLPFIKKTDIGVTPWGTFITDTDTKMTTMQGVFAGGDVARGPDEVIRAIADGKQAAMSIDIFCGGTGKLNKGRAIEIPELVDEDEVLIHNRFPQECLPVESRTTNFEEVLLGYHKLNAIAESMRCLHCDRR
ncbi:MAG: FAD-dependent oxidoreductase [Eubacteriales bacterium]|nr:FAD-dependent oxidoreductase [Eubacteriales bacterium]